MPLDFLLQRRSVVAKQLEEPGPDAAQIKELIRVAIRVPDHKALAPWRFLVFTEQARADFGEKLADIYTYNQGEDCKLRCVDSERSRFLRAPVVIAVISSPQEATSVSITEQLLSAGAACQNILLGATALGYGAQWITEWIAYDKQVHVLMELQKSESVAGFIHIGTAMRAPKERSRISPENVMTYWSKSDAL